VVVPPKTVPACDARVVGRLTGERPVDDPVAAALETT
jgi:hypothetical protein